MQIQGRWQGRFGQVFSDLRARSTTFASLHLRAFAFFSSNKPGISARDPLPLRLCNLMNVLLKVMMEFQDLRPA
jgi:hypothetical protein